MKEVLIHVVSSIQKLCNHIVGVVQCQRQQANGTVDRVSRIDPLTDRENVLWFDTKALAPRRVTTRDRHKIASHNRLGVVAVNVLCHPLADGPSVQDSLRHEKLATDEDDQRLGRIEIGDGRCKVDGIDIAQESNLASLGLHCCCLISFQSVDDTFGPHPKASHSQDERITKGNSRDGLVGSRPHLIREDPNLFSQGRDLLQILLHIVHRSRGRRMHRSIFVVGRSSEDVMQDRLVFGRIDALSHAHGFSAVGQSDGVGEIEQEFHRLAVDALSTVIEEHESRNLCRETSASGSVVAEVAQVKLVVGAKEIGLGEQGVKLWKIGAFERLGGEVAHRHGSSRPYRHSVYSRVLCSGLGVVESQQWTRERACEVVAMRRIFSSMVEARRMNTGTSSNYV